MIVLTAYAAFVLILWSAVCCAHAAHRVVVNYKSATPTTYAWSFMWRSILCELPIAVIVVGLVFAVAAAGGSLNQAFLYWSNGAGAAIMWGVLFIGVFILDFIPKNWTDRFRPLRFRNKI